MALTYLQNTHLNFIITIKPTFSYINTELLAEKLAYVLADAFNCMSGFISQLIDAVEQHMALVTIMTAALILKHSLIQTLCSITFVLTWNELTIRQKRLHQTRQVLGKAKQGCFIERAHKNPISINLSLLLLC